MSEIKDNEFESFFSDKNNVSMSSYRVDPKTNLPLLYLKDNKQALWQKFEATYPDGIKRTSFMARLASGRYVYRQDLGGLCNICNEYCYEVFDVLINLVQSNVEQESRVYINFKKHITIILLKKFIINYKLINKFFNYKN
jgi:hypothetical protein